MRLFQRDSLGSTILMKYELILFEKDSPDNTTPIKHKPNLKFQFKILTH